MPLSSVVGAQSIVRPGVCTSSTRPASPYDGQVIYETDTDKTLVWNGTGWVFLSTSRANAGGLDFITASGAQSAQANIAVNSCFSSTYNNYRVVITNLILSSAANLQIRLRSGTTDTSGTGYHNTRIESNNAGTVSGIGLNATSYWSPSYISNSTDGTSIVMDFLRPFESIATMATSQSVRTDSTTSLTTVTGSHYHNTATSFDGFNIVPASGTVTCNNIRVYGYVNS